MKETGGIACVTGGRGIVGKQIVELLLGLGFQVRVLSRKFKSLDDRLEVFEGDLLNEELLARFFSGAELVFHCAAELHDQALMWDVNVKGTESVLASCKKESVKYLCYLSSAGVIGKTGELLVTEHTHCHPQNTYERTKWAAEQLVQKGGDGVNVVILRPTNVVDRSRPGALLLGKSAGLKSKLKIFLKGGECAHLVHAEDVARAAMYFIDSCFEKPECFFVSCDHEEDNTFAGIVALYRSLYSSLQINPPFHLPIFIPYFIRRLARGGGNLGSVRYSSAKLMGYGFSYKFTLTKMMDDMALKHGK